MPVWTVQAFSNQQQGASDSTHSTGHLAAGLAGLAAVPIVAWSEYTLKTSGEGWHLSIVCLQCTSTL